MPRRTPILTVALLLGLMLPACGSRPAPEGQTAGTQAPTAVSIAVHTVEATAAPAYAPAARLVSNSQAGACRWDIFMSLTGFAPNSIITVTSDFDETDCVTGAVVTGASWTEPYETRTDAVGRLMIGYLHEGTGSYRYVFVDELGNRASLSFTTAPPPSPTTRPKATATARPRATATRTPLPTRAPATRTPRPTTAPAPQAVVESATLNLRGGPGLNYPVLGQVARGDMVFVMAGVANCGWLQVAVPGLSGSYWVAGGSQYVSLTVPCETLPVAAQVPPTPLPAPTAAPRPVTGLLFRSSSNNGPGELLVKNGTDRDGVVILVDLGESPIQAAYIRASQSYRMTQVGDGSYRLYFSKGEGWDAARKEFTRNVTRQRFDQTLAFTSGGGQYTSYEVTLYGVAGGTASTQNVPPGQFPGVP